MNKLIGLGFDGALDLSVLDHVEREWRDRAEPVRAELQFWRIQLLGAASTERGTGCEGSRTCWDDC